MEMHKHVQRGLTVTLTAAALLFFVPAQGWAQCGDADCSGSVGVGDLTFLLDYLVINGGPLYCPANVEFDGYHLVTVRDLLMLYDGYPGGWSNCGETISTPFVPPTDSNFYLLINEDKYPASATEMYITVDIVAGQPLRLLDLPFAIRVGGEIPFSVHDLTGTGCEWIASEGVVQCFRSGIPAIGAGTTRLFSLYIQAAPPTDVVPITYSYITQPPIQDAERVRSAMAILNDGWYTTFEPLIDVVPDCCVGSVGNVDCDPDDKIDVSDLTVFIEWAFINVGNQLCCEAEANCDGSANLYADVGDITALIDYLFITFTPLPSCP